MLLHPLPQFLNGGLPPPAPASRKRKRPHQQMSVSYSEVTEFAPDGQLREVIVIEDTPPPHPPGSTTTLSPTITLGAGSLSYQPPHLHSVRTRAQAAKAMGAPPPQKKRKRETDDVVYPVKKPLTLPSTSRTWTVPDESKGPPPWDDKEGHYIIVPDDIIHDRYRTVRLLGQGTFGKVVEAVDIRTGAKVAIKIIRAIQKYRDASRIEVRVLNKLRERDPINKYRCIHLVEWFDHRNHICLVSELLGMCVYDFLKENDFSPFPRPHIKDFARQLLGSVAFLHDLRLVHTDLKPENILLVKNDFRCVPVPGATKRSAHKVKRILNSTDIRLIDFGSATFEEEYHSSVVSTRHYRAPEIILGLGWSFPCDAFSLGCILIEFYTGLALFQTHDNLEHLAMMEAVLGPMPDRFARAGARSKPEFFRSDNRLNWPPPKASRQSKKDVKATRALEAIVSPADHANKQFVDLVRQLLHFDPQQRMTVREALSHPYFTTPIPDEL